MSNTLDFIWPIVFFIGCFLLLASHAAKSNKEDNGDLKNAYKYAMWGGLTLILSTFILLAMRAMH